MLTKLTNYHVQLTLVKNVTIRNGLPLSPITMSAAVATHCHFHPPPPGWVLIDRSGKHFGTVLNFLRDGSVSLPETRRELMELSAEAK